MTTELIDERNQNIPFILQFGAVTSNRKKLMKYVTPVNTNFAINLKAPLKNGIYKEEFLNKDPN